MRFCTPTKKQETGYRRWVRKLPEPARALAERFDPWTLYLLKSTGHRVMIQSFSDDGTMTVIVSGKFNLVLHEREVFGISADDLEECDLPAAGEQLGAALSRAEAADNLDALRVMVRPDLWTMGEDGKAMRKQ